MSSALIAEAFDRLCRHDLVFGPAADEGYYLIGGNAESLRHGAPYLGAGIGWGTAGVLDQTLDILRAMGLSHALLTPSRMSTGRVISRKVCKRCPTDRGGPPYRSSSRL
ncbi:MAG: DUF2064 domain-containing protein [Desulfobacterales bacterium]|nr:DUF2064 domain-containing protein [Desulfobacterales bacterium]